MMRLWEAIVRGAEAHPQSFGALCEFDAQANTTGTCAQGAALHALGFRVPFALYRVYSNHPTIKASMNIFVAACPTCGLGSGYPKGWELYRLIAHMNDIHKLTRPAIASIVYQHEREALGVDPEDDVQYQSFFAQVETPIEVKT